MKADNLDLAKYHAQQTEEEFQQQVIDLAHYDGWKVAHFRKARIMVNGKETYRTPVQADGTGFPDLILVKGKRLIAAELKIKRGGRIKMTAEQWDWLEALGRAGTEVYTWIPEDWEDIVEILSNERG